MAAKKKTDSEEKRVKHPKVEELPAKETSLGKTPVEGKQEESTPITEEPKGILVEETSEEEESTTESDDSLPKPEEQELSPETEEIFKERPPEEEVLLKKVKKKLFITGFLVAVFVFALIGGIFYLTNRFNQQTKEEVTAGIEEQQEPTPIPTPNQLDREEISLEILNGSGVSGAAAEIAEIFEDLGYKIVEIGNANRTEGNQLYENPNTEDLIDILLEDVENELDISSISGELDDSTASARIILGR